MDEAKPELSRRDVVVFVIDARKPMLEHQLGGLPFAFVALDCVARCMTERIVSAESDLMAVVLVGTAKTGNAYDFAHQSVLMPLAELRASRIRELRNLVAEAKLFGKGDFGADIGGPMEEGEEGRLSVSMALHHVQLLLSKELKANDATKRCIFFTCADHAGAPLRRRAAAPRDCLLPTRSRSRARARRAAACSRSSARGRARGEHEVARHA